VLRDLEPRDFDAWVQAHEDDPQLLRDIGTEEAPTRGSLRRLLRREAGRRGRGEAIGLVIADRDGDAFLGQMILHSFHWRFRRCDVGFFLVPAARGAGRATEALRLLVDWAFRELGMVRVGLMTAPWNEPTMRLAERCGFAPEGVLRAYTIEFGERVDNHVYSVVAP
jgi:RimJ/RimL family protein N-acetyltransferase